jgi:hypothetical protein
MTPSDVGSFYLGVFASWRFIRIFLLGCGHAGLGPSDFHLWQKMHFYGIGKSAWTSVLCPGRGKSLVLYVITAAPMLPGISPSVRRKFHP